MVEPELKDIRDPVLLAMGANLPSDIGPPEATIAAALGALVVEKIEVLAVSRMFRSPAFPAGSGPDYVNGAVLCRTPLAIGELLPALHRIEQAHGRQRAKRWGARCLDIDLLAVGPRIHPDRETHVSWQGLSLNEQLSRAPEQLILPHPRLHERAFVLIPLADVAPVWRHPVLGQTVVEMLAALPKSELGTVTPLESA